MVEIGTYLYVLQIPFLLLFLGGLFGVLQRAEGGSGTLAVSALGAGVAMVVIACMGAVISGLAPTIAQLGGDAAAVKAIDGMTPLTLALSAFPRALLLGATSVVLLESGISALTIALLRSTGAESNVAPRTEPTRRSSTQTLVGYEAAEAEDTCIEGILAHRIVQQYSSGTTGRNDRISNLKNLIHRRFIGGSSAHVTFSQIYGFQENPGSETSERDSLDDWHPPHLL